MGIEIERKFLVTTDFVPPPAGGTQMVQGYLNRDPQRTVRVRLAGDRGFITVKGPSHAGGLSRSEWEWAVPVADARELLELCLPDLVEKVRYKVPHGSHVFEVDVFSGVNAGLVLAEVELSETEESFEKPPWLGTEVTGDNRYYNSYLSQNPYRKWQ